MKPRPFAQVEFVPGSMGGWRVVLASWKLRLAPMYPTRAIASFAAVRINAAAEKWHAERCASCAKEK